MAQLLPIYLQLPHEMGGTRFGPFKERIDVGSDGKRNQLVLNAGYGIFPHHAVAVQTESGMLTLQPVGPQCQVFVIPAGQAHPWPVRAPVQVKSGDQIVFGTPTGPRFAVWADMSALKSSEQLLSEAQAKGGEAGALHAMGAAMDKVMGAPKVGGVAGEVHRRAGAEFLTRSPFREIYAVWTRARTGVLTNPRTIIGVAIALIGLLGTGGLTCSGVLFAVWRTVMQ